MVYELKRKSASTRVGISQPSRLRPSVYAILASVCGDHAARDGRASCLTPCPGSRLLVHELTMRSRRAHGCLMMPFRTRCVRCRGVSSLLCAWD